jgi:uncharacterized protein (DUF58 family)
MSDALREALIEGERAGGQYALRLPRRLPIGAAGGHQGARAGSSLEFREHREYEPGDDLRHIDWNAYARSDQLVVKLYHEEVTPHLDIVLDGSRSMALEGTPKAAAATGLAALFAMAAGNAGMSHRVWLAQDGCALVEGSQFRPSLWQPPNFDFPGHVGDAFARRPPRFKSRGFRVIISDLLWLGDPMQVLGPCSERATSLVVFQVLAQADARPVERGNLRLCDSESDQYLDLLVDDAAIARYLRTLDRHQSAWHDACRRVGAVMSKSIAEPLVRDWRMDDLLTAEVLQAT